MTKVSETPKTALDLLRQSRKRICSFCLKTQREVRKMIESGETGAVICDECIGLCNDILGAP